jgi:hypothetical protein
MRLGVIDFSAKHANIGTLYLSHCMISLFFLLSPFHISLYHNPERSSPMMLHLMYTTQYDIIPHVPEYISSHTFICIP